MKKDSKTKALKKLIVHSHPYGIGFTKRHELAKTSRGKLKHHKGQLVKTGKVFIRSYDKTPQKINPDDVPF